MKMANKKALGFLGFFALFAFPGILHGDITQGLWLIWVVWFVYFFVDVEK